LAWVNTDRKNGGLGEMKIPLIADFTKKIATDYGVLKEDEGKIERRSGNAMLRSVHTLKLLICKRG